jgi:UDPglucose 6-dehydrogenase
MNEIANLCEKVGANVDQVRIGMGSDNRIGKRFLFPGIGYGGSCFPKDVQALAKTAGNYAYDFKILKSVMKVNTIQKGVLSKKIRRHYKNELAGRTIAIWGLAFKPNTDDIREAPALTIIDDLLAQGVQIRAFDPEAMENIRAVYGDRIQLCGSMYEALNGADCLCILTEWSEFRTPDFARMATLLRDHVIFDGRNLYDLDQVKDMGFSYISIGRPKVKGKKRS